MDTFRLKGMKFSINNVLNSVVFTIFVINVCSLPTVGLNEAVFDDRRSKQNQCQTQETHSLQQVQLF